MYHFYSGGGKNLEYCFNVEAKKPLNLKELAILRQILTEGFISEEIKTSPQFQQTKIVELGPRLNFATAFSTNAVSICHACGLTQVTRIEKSRRYAFEPGADKKEFILQNHDRMTECCYQEPLKAFKTGIKPKPVFPVLLIEKGIGALQKINKEMGLGMDDWDLNFYYNLFLNEIKRNPTNVECFQLGQANSEHSRHWFFKGRIFIDGKETPEALLQAIQAPLKVSRNNNSVIAFKDNSSAIKGYKIETIIPRNFGKPSSFEKKSVTYHITFTAETHNFPSGVAPFPGAETGGGGRIRDGQATGKGSLVIAGTAGYCVGNLKLPGYVLPWENKSFAYPDNLASPLKIEIEASNGASDYGNKFGEPIIQGYTRSFGLVLPNGERQEWLKPIMFTGGVGQINDEHINKEKPKKGMLIIQIGGPAYRIGMGGGAASSMIQGQNVAELDFNAVQRGDAEMEQKMNRVVRACVEMGSKNPIISIHDQGAGGPCNVLTELVEPTGGKINIRKIRLGDETLSVLEIWGAEYQERNALLIYPDRIDEFKEICRRERSDFEILGEITEDGKIVVFDPKDKSKPVNLEIAKILGKMPQKTFNDSRKEMALVPLAVPKNISFKKTLDNVLRLLSVGSKRFLTCKVDRSVTGLIARQQCCGPVQLTVSDVAVVAQSHFGLTGGAIAIGEQPIKMLVNPRAGARMAVGEAITNVMFARISALKDVKCSGNWMWAAKLPGEASRLYDAAIATRDIMISLGIAIDGGKDSLSMAAKVANEIVKSPGELVVSAYATMPDVTKVITPDFKKPGKSEIWLIDLGNKKCRLGGSALAQTLNQIGNDSPDVEDPLLLKRCFSAIQEMIDKKTILSGHDRSDGGLVTAFLEMAFSGNCGLEISQPISGIDPISFYFNEELGLVLEIDKKEVGRFLVMIKKYKLERIAYRLGKTAVKPEIKIKSANKIILSDKMEDLRQTWEETSYQLNRLQTNKKYADEEKKNIYRFESPKYKINYTPKNTPREILNKANKPKVAIIREEGSNGDREMTSAFFTAGFEPWDVMMTDLLEGRADLQDFRGVVFVGGFSYADVFGSAKGWASTIRFSGKLKKMFDDFYNRPDTFSLGVCNGCQLMGLLGWVPWRGITDDKQPRFVRNKSKRFESRWVSVKIQRSPSMMLKGMEDSVLGIWVAHGEGQLSFLDKSILKDMLKKKLAAIHFVDDKNNFTEKYPFNPNGSPLGITGVCSPDGRHLAMMPHPERAFLKWQWSWMPSELKDKLEASPWLKMFQNAFEWCEENK